MRNNYPFYRYLIAFLLFCFGGGQLFAANKTFSGPGNFSTAARWSGGTLPAAGDDITIDGSCIFDDNRGLTYGRLILGNPSPAGVITWPIGGTQRLIADRIIMNNAGSTINMTNGGILRVLSSWNFNAGVFTPGTGTVEWYMGGSVSLPASITTYNNLVIQTGATISTYLSANITVRNLTLTSGILDARALSGGLVYNIIVTGNWTNSGTFISRTGTVTFNGTTAQLLNGTIGPALNNLTINNALGLTISNVTTVNGILTFTNGRITTGAQVLVIGSTGSVSGAAAGRYVNGNLRKTFTVGSNISRSFEVGNASTYNPVTLTFPTVSTSGTITVSENSGDHPQIGSSCINAAESVNFYWSVINTTVTPANYNASFTFTAADYDAGSSPNLFGLQHYNGVWTIPIVSGRTSTNISAAGLTTFGTFAIGESNTPVSLTIASDVGTNVCPGTKVTMTATPVNPGAAPFYQWKKNGLDVGTNSATYIDSTVAPGDSIRCVITSNAPCAFLPTVSSINTFFSPIVGVWMGVTSTNWQTTTNWCGSVLPISTTNIVVNSGVPFMPALTSAVTINNLTLSAATNLTLGGNTLTVNGNLSGTGDIIGSSTSTLILNGTGSETLRLEQTARSNRSLLNLTVNRSGGGTVTLSDSLLVYGTVTLSNGTLATSDKLRLMSTASGTARIGVITTGNITGNITMERYLSGGAWKLLGAPVSGASLSSWYDDFTMGGFPGSHYPTVTNSSIVTYDESLPGIYDSGYVAPSGIGQSIGATQGVWAYIINTPLTLDVTGGVIKGNQSISLSYTNNDLSTEVGWNLLANPYPSTIDWDAVGWTKINMDPALYMFDGASEQYSSYVGGIGVNGGSRYIPSSHGFLVQAYGSGASLAFGEGVKSAADPAFMKINTAQSDPLIKLKVTGAAGSDETVVRLNNSATQNYDMGLDASKLINYASWAPVIASVAGTRDMAINSVAMPSQDLTIPIRVVVWSSGTYTITKESISALPALSCVILEDKKTGTKTNLSTNSSYTVYLSDTAWSPRFLLHITAPTELSVSPDLCTNGTAIANLPSGTFNLVWKDNAGNVISSKNNIQDADTITQLAAGIYTLTLSRQGSMCPSLSDTLIIEEETSFVQVAPTDATCQQSGDGSMIFSCNENAGIELTVEYDGSTIFNGDVHGNQTISTLMPGDYILNYTGTCVSGTDTVTIGTSDPVAASFTISSDTAFLNMGASFYFTNTSFGSISQLWDFGDGNIDTCFSCTHAYSSPGVYTVSLISSGAACSDTAVFDVVVLPVTIRELNSSDVLVYLSSPSTLHLSAGKEMNGSYILNGFDQFGRRVINSQISHIDVNGIDLPIPTLASGIYSFILTGGNAPVSVSLFIP